MRRGSCCLAFALLVPLHLQAQEPRVELSVSGGKARMHVAAGSGTILDLSAHCGCATIDHAELLYDITKQSRRYLLLDLSGPSRANGGMNYCGSGIESNRVWLELDADFSILAATTFLTESCMRTVERYRSEFDARTRVMEWRASSYSQMKDFVLRYDLLHPELGLQVKASAIEP